MTLGENAQVFMQKATGEVVDVTDFVRYRRSDLNTFAGRSTELDQIGAGRLELALDNSTGIFTPGRSGASVQLTLGMPIWVRETLGYRTFDLFSGFLELPDVAEVQEGVDNLIAVNAVDRKQLLDGGRTFVSTLGAHIVGSPTLRNYYPLNESAGPWTDAVGKGPAFAIELSRTSLADSSTALPGYTAAGGVRVAGDDVQGVKFEPTLTDAGGFGFPIVAQGWQLVADYQQMPVGDRPQFGADEALTFVMWVALDNINDGMGIFGGFLDNLAFTQPTIVDISRVMIHSTMGADSGLLIGQVSDAVGGALDGVAKTAGYYVPSPTAMVPIGLQISVSTISLWVGDQAYDAVVTPNSPSWPLQVFGTVYLGRLSGSIAHFQIHVGTPDAFTHDDFLEQYRVGLEGMVYDTTSERIARILRYVSPTDPIPAVLDDGQTFMQRASLAGKKPGQAIDEAVDTERGRFFVDGAGICRFHDRVRTHYNL